MAAPRGTVEEFIDDIEPFFYGRRLTYVDVGAFRGEVFKKLKASRLRIRETHLIEPNPDSASVLREEVRELIEGQNAHIHQLAVGGCEGTLRFRRAQSMTKVVGAQTDAVDVDSLFEVPAVTLDALSTTFGERHVSLLKIDVEGHELEVLRGAEELLKKQLVDMVYIEAGMRPEGGQQCYWRDIDDSMLGHGYRLFRIYEQMYEWIEDSPWLRRVNLAYMSPAFSANNPYRITQELFAAKRQLATAKESKEALAAKLAEAQSTSRERAAEIDVLRAKAADTSRLLQEATERAAASSVAVERLEVERARLLADADRERKAAAAQAAQAAEQVAAEQAKLLADADRERNAAAARVTELSDLLRRTRAERDAVERRTRALAEDRQVIEMMSREVLRLYDGALSGQRRAIQKEANTRRTLAYRLGSMLLGSVRKPQRWPWVPVELARLYGEYRSDKANRRLGKLAAPTETLEFYKGRLAFVPKTAWQTIVLPATEGPTMVRLTTLSVSLEGMLRVEVSTQSLSLFATLRALGVKPVTADDELAVDSSVAVLDLEPRRSIELCTLSGEVLEMRMRKLRGVPSILKLELQALGTAARSDADGDTSIAATLSPLPPLAGEAAVDKMPAAIEGSGAKTPKPMKSAIVWQAAQIMDAGHVDAAIAFAERHARALNRPAVSLLKANRAVGDDDQWLRHVNDYIAQFQLLPLQLAANEGSLFHRLTTAEASMVERGPVVTVIMPAFNCEATLEVAARSVLRQSWRPLELVIVDDCSEDGTYAVAQAIARSDPRVRVVRNRFNVGPYVSKNLALTVASGEFVTGHDADDWAHPQRIERHVLAMLSSEGKLRASMTRMLRLDEKGVFGHFAKEGKTSDDGVLRDAAISCMFEATLLRNELGFWDSVRFGADSELIGRAERVLGDGFARLRQLAMLCLDHPASLTNDPVTGVSRVHGISSTRRFYRDQWTDWHESLDPAHAFLPFPHVKRLFAVPEAAAVPEDRLHAVIAGLGTPSDA